MWTKRQVRIRQIYIRVFQETTVVPAQLNFMTRTSWNSKKSFIRSIHDAKTASNCTKGKRLLFLRGLLYSSPDFVHTAFVCPVHADPTKVLGRKTPKHHTWLAAAGSNLKCLRKKINLNAKQKACVHVWNLRLWMREQVYVTFCCVQVWKISTLCLTTRSHRTQNCYKRIMHFERKTKLLLPT